MYRLEIDVNDDARCIKFTKELAGTLADVWDGRFFHDVQALVGEGKIAWTITPDFVNSALEVCRSEHTRKVLKTLLAKLNSMGQNEELYVDGQPFKVVAGISD